MSRQKSKETFLAHPKLDVSAGFYLPAEQLSSNIFFLQDAIYKDIKQFSKEEKERAKDIFDSFSTKIQNEEYAIPFSSPFSPQFSVDGSRLNKILDTTHTLLARALRLRLYNFIESLIQYLRPHKEHPEIDFCKKLFDMAEEFQHEISELRGGVGNKAKEVSNPPLSHIRRDPWPLISERQRQAAKSNAYVAPSRIGKKALAGYFSEDILAELKTLAAVQKRTTQSLLEEAIGILFEKYEKDIVHVRKILHRDPS